MKVHRTGKRWLKSVYIPVLTTLLTFICFYECNTTEPPIDNIEPGRRDYEWTVDTLNAPAGNIFYLWQIWGHDTTNIWIAGQGDTPYNLWLYDGISWKPCSQNIDGNFGSIFGFSRSDIWLCGIDKIYRYNGSTWTGINNFPYPNVYSTSLEDIRGINNKDIYVVGGATKDFTGENYLGVIFHFDGSVWTHLNISEERIGFNLVRQVRDESDIYLSGARFETVGDTNKIFMFNGKILKQIWSGIEIATVNELAGKVYLVIGNKIYKYKSYRLEVWKDFSGTNYLGRVWGRSEKDFFGVASDGLAHYNGTDLVTIYPTNFFINDLFVMEKDIYMLCENRIIIHGKLKD